MAVRGWLSSWAMPAAISPMVAMRDTFSSRPCRTADGSCTAASTAGSRAEPGPGGAFRTRSLLMILSAYPDRSIHGDAGVVCTYFHGPRRHAVARRVKLNTGGDAGRVHA